MNKVYVMGNITRDPELSKFGDDRAVCNFTVAHNNGKTKDNKELPADFIPCKAWDKRAETIAKYCHKGDKILVSGAFKTDTYKDKTHDDVTHYSSYVNVSDFEFAGGKNNNTEVSQQPQSAPAETTSSDDLPF